MATNHFADAMLVAFNTEGAPALPCAVVLEAFGPETVAVRDSLRRRTYIVATLDPGEGTLFLTAMEGMSKLGTVDSVTLWGIVSGAAYAFLRNGTVPRGVVQ